jgi:hypothetical protein
MNTLQCRSPKRTGATDEAGSCTYRARIQCALYAMRAKCYVAATEHYGGILWHFDSSEGSGANDIYLIAGNHEIWHFDGTSWRNAYTRTGGLYEIWGS